MRSPGDETATCMSHTLDSHRNWVYKAHQSFDYLIMQSLQAKKLFDYISIDYAKFASEKNYWLYLQFLDIKPCKQIL
jgi:hypothetical protein